MKRTFALFILVFAWCNIFSQEDSLRTTRYVMRSFLAGAGRANVFDTYLSPLEYQGPEVRILFENMRMTGLMGGNVSAQHVFQADFSYTKNPAQTARMYTGMINWTYALHYQFRLNERLKILAGPQLDLNGGCIYNNRNSNNPAQAKAYGSIGVSGMVIYKMRIKDYPLTVRYQANLPLLGAMFSPEYGESYYEIFSRGNRSGVVPFTSIHNKQAMKNYLTVDFPIGKFTFRAGYLNSLYYLNVNGIRSHILSNSFVIGFVKEFVVFGDKHDRKIRYKSAYY